MRESSNPVFRSLPKQQGGYAHFGTGAAGYGAQQVHAQPYAQEYLEQPQTGVSRPLTIDDVVTKTGITLAAFPRPVEGVDRRRCSKWNRIPREDFV